MGSDGLRRWATTVRALARATLAPFSSELFGAPHPKQPLKNGQLSAVLIGPATEWAMADDNSRPEGRLVQARRRPRAQFGRIRATID